MATQYVTCPNCRSQNMAGTGLCTNCGTQLPQIGMPIQQMSGQKLPGADKKIAAGICGILLNGLGVHKFLLGYQNEGIIMLSVYLGGLILSFFTCGITGLASMAIAVIGIVEGIIYLTKSDEEFVRTYVQNKKPWF
jgi:TM2 domain-containing membrane protein YozV